MLVSRARLYASASVHGLVGPWSSPLEDGFLGLAIDEFGNRDPEVDQVLAEALLEIRRRYPDAYLAVSHGGLIKRVHAAAYAEAADLVSLETYLDGAQFLSLRLGFRLANVRRFGLQHKTVASLGISDSRFADTDAEIRAQVRWLVENSRDFAGIGFYASNATRKHVGIVDATLANLLSHTHK